MKILFPIESTEFHPGHRAIIEYGKSLGEVIIATSREKGIDTYLLTGKRTGLVNDLEKFLSDCEEMGVTPHFYEYPIQEESVRLEQLRRVKGLMEIYKNQLILDEHINECTAALMRPRMRETVKCDMILRGPEILSFFLRSVGEILKWPSIGIISEVIKDEVAGIKCQSALISLTEVAKRKISAIKRILGESQKSLKVGLNDELTTDLNQMYEGEGWSVISIVVFEGGIMRKGRLEVTRFRIEDGKNSVILQEADYYV